MNRNGNDTRRISSSYWMGDDTFVVEFDRELTTIEPFNKGDFNILMVEYHKDEDKWVLYLEYYDSDENYIEQTDDCFTEKQKEMYFSMAQLEYKRVTCG